MLVLHRLLPRLIAAEADGRLRGDVTLVPQANPIGVQQFRGGRLLGRFDAASGHNFNRGFGDPASPIAVWQAALLELAGDATIMLDLHTDDEALPYLYLHTALWPQASDLAARMASRVAILWDGDGGGGAFEDAVMRRWIAAGDIAGKLTATIELRGQADVDAATADADADGLYRLLCRRGVIDDDARSVPWAGLAVPIAHMQTIHAPESGIVLFHTALGDTVAAGEVFAHLIAAPGQPEIPLRAPQAGMMLTRSRDRLLQTGTVVAKFTGDAPSPDYAGGVLDA